MKPAIHVQNLGKRFRIGVAEEHQDTLMGKCVHLIKKPLQNLSKLKALTSFREKEEENGSILWALKDISFDIMPGEIVGLIGLNGTGKSTLLKVLSKITTPTSGSAVLRGRIAGLLEVGTGFHPELTGRENIYLNGTILGMTKAEVNAKLDAIIDFSEVERFIDTPVKRYSSGMRVRLGFSVAAHLDPEILLIDEVLAVGDVAFQRKCLGKMDEVANKGRTVIFVSHNMEMIQRLCPRTLLLKGGSLAMDGPTKNVVDRYFNLPIFQEQDGERLEASPRYKHYGRDFRFQKCHVLNAKGQRASRLLLGEPFSIFIEGIAYRNLENLDYSVAILSPERVMITSFLLSEGNGFLHFKKNQVQGLQLDYTDFKPNSGKYLVSLTCLYQKAGIDVVSSACSFEVSDLNHDMSQPLLPVEGFVRFRPLCRWKPPENSTV